jgi:c-di-AMP phosphodiesterase-like protein
MNNFFKNLDEQIEIHDNVIIMGHSNPDLDCIGSSIGLYNAIDKEKYIFKTTEKLNDSTEKAFKELEKEKINFIDKTNYKNKIKNTLLIITDLHRKSLLEYEEILNEIKDVVVIDHHIIGPDKIKTTIEYIDSKASSATEIVTHYLKYKEKKVNNIIATIMLAGIEIDTNGYNMKTTEHTFKTAAYLMSLGADNILKQQILKIKKEDYINRTKQIDNSYMKKNMMICKLEGQNYNPSYLATMSEDLLRFDKVEASFTIGKLSNGKIGISARSLGNINVEKIMANLGGGGHLTDAACQMTENIDESEKKLLEQLEEV